MLTLRGEYFLRVSELALTFSDYYTKDLKTAIITNKQHSIFY